MSPDVKNELGSKVDTLLASWAAPPREDAAWQASAEAIVAAAQSAQPAEDAALAALFAPPSLSPEPGEASPTNVSEGRARPSAPGEKSMSQDSNPGSPAKPESSPMSGPMSGPMSAATSKRPSLKELAARASQAGASVRPSVAPGSIPPPAVSRSLSEAPPPPAEKPARGSAPSSPPRSLDAGKEDSGIVDLNAINKAATPQQVAAAEVAKPAAHDLMDEAEKSAVAASDAGKVKSLDEARAKKKGAGATWGIVVAIVGLAAAGAIVLRGKPQPPSPMAGTGQDKPAIEAPAVQQGEAPKVAEAPKPTSTGLSLDSLPSEPSPSEAPKGGGPAAAGDPGKLAAAPAAGGTDTPAAAPTTGTTAAPPSGKPGDLSSAMAQAVGGSTDKGADGAEDAVPAAGGKKGGNQNIPEQPSQGSVASAVGAVMPGAKGCVAGADDVSRAQITFSSNGTVSNVSVTGWAAANGKTACVKAALKAANAGAFSKPSFTVGVTIRP